MTDDTDTLSPPVGYGRPPKHTRFRKGRSGNPHGRPSKIKPPVDRIAVQDILLERRTVTIRGKKQELTNADILFRTLMEKAIGGDAASMRTLMSCLDKWGIVDKAVKGATFDVAGAKAALAEKINRLLAEPEPEPRPDQPAS